MTDDLPVRVIRSARLRSVTVGGGPCFEAMEVSPDINPAQEEPIQLTVSRETVKHPGLVGLAFINGFALPCLAWGFHHIWLIEGIRTAWIVATPFAVALAASLTVMVLAARQHPTERASE